MLSLLSGDWSQDEKLSILKAAAKLSSRGGMSSPLIPLLKEPPPGVSQEMVAQAISDASYRTSMSSLEEALRAISDRGAQECISRALLRAGGRQGLQILVEAASDPAGGVDPALLSVALEEYGGPNEAQLMLDLFRRGDRLDVLEPLARGIARLARVDIWEDLLSFLNGSATAEQKRAIASSLDQVRGSIDRARIASILGSEVEEP